LGYICGGEDIVGAGLGGGGEGEGLRLGDGVSGEGEDGAGCGKASGQGEGLMQAAFAGRFRLSTPSTTQRRIARPNLGYKERFDSIGLYLKIY
jgi:hypothetical protein